MMEDMMEQLNEAQKDAVTTTEGYVRVIAGAGSGKTKALTRRFAYLVNMLGILPEHILCVTFTNKAANEMRQRIHQLTGDDDTGYINTFHGFCVSVLQEDSHAVSYPKNFLVIDNSDIDDMLAIIYDERKLTSRNMTFGMARDMIEIRKLFKEPDYYKEMIALPLEQLKAKYDAAEEPGDIIFYGYLYQEKKCFALDYNDLLKFTLYIFQENEPIRSKWQQRLEYIMIDEFQDIDMIQYELMTVLCGYHHNLFVVGDPDQTIYSWRGADGRYLMDFDKAFPGTKTIMMMQNYRSTPQILACANDLISHNQQRIEKSLIPMLVPGPGVSCHFLSDAAKEAETLAVDIMKLHETGVPYRDMTVLYRAHYVTRPIEERFLQDHIPYTIYSGTPFYSRKEIKDVLAYLRMLCYGDDLSFARIVNVPRRNIGKQRMALLKTYAAKKNCTLYEALQTLAETDDFKRTQARAFIRLIEEGKKETAFMPVSEILSYMGDRSGYEALLRTEGSQERLDNLAELKQSVYELETTCGEECTLAYYLSHVALCTNADTAETGDTVKLMTIHAAKGLEFPHVFLCAMNEGIFPSRKTKDRAGMEEERRLAFVAVTRAEKSLQLYAAGGLHFDGSLRYPSRFLLDMKEKLTFEPPLSPQLVEETETYVQRQQRRFGNRQTEAAFAEGDSVQHPAFGRGTIMAVDEDKKTYQIQFEKLATTREISWRVPLKS